MSKNFVFGCDLNRSMQHLFSKIGEEDVAGGIQVAAIGGTRMACAEDRFAAAEGRYLETLQQVNRISFMAGELMLSWGQGSEFGSLYFRRDASEFD